MMKNKELIYREDMIEGLCRGIRKDNGEFVYGYYVVIPCGRYMREEHLIQTIKDNGRIGMLYEVIPETVGQFTGAEIGAEKLFKGDVIEWYESYDDPCGFSRTVSGRAVVIWDKKNFCWAFESDDKQIQPFSDWDWESNTIIGNIHMNPNLMK